MKNRTFVTNNFEETKILGEKIAKDLKSGGVLVLYGELGSGKTTFVQGFAKGLGIKRRIISPTFIIVRTYKLETQKSKVKSQNYNSKLKSLERFYHIDLYRIQNEKKIEDLGIGEIINDPNSVVAIEWGEKMGSLLPKKRWNVRFEYLDEERRKIAINEYY